MEAAETEHSCLSPQEAAASSAVVWVKDNYLHYTGS